MINKEWIEKLLDDAITGEINEFDPPIYTRGEANKMIQETCEKILQDIANKNKIEKYFPEYPVCKTCGSEEVSKDALASYNKELEKWELVTTYDKPNFCEKCDGETSLKWVTDERT